MKRFVLRTTTPWRIPYRSRRTRRALNFLLKLILVVLLAWILYRQRVKGQDLQAIYAYFQVQISDAQGGWLLLCLVLMPLNWLLESLKWRQFTRPFSNESLRNHLEAVLAGVTFSLFTPNRLGDYAGRLIVHEYKKKERLFVATLAANYVQLLVLLFLGWGGALHFIPTYTGFDLGRLLPVAILGVGGGTLAALILFYNRELLLFVKKQRFIQRMRFVRHSMNVGKTYSRRRIFSAMGTATARYAVYGVQYYCMLRFTGIHVSGLAAASGIATTFLIQTSVPLPPTLGLIARGEIALFVWGLFDANELSTLTASYGLFFINLLLPGLWGLVTVIRKNLVKPEQYENEYAPDWIGNMGNDLADGPEHPGRK